MAVAVTIWLIGLGVTSGLNPIAGVFTWPITLGEWIRDYLERKGR